MNRVLWNSKRVCALNVEKRTFIEILFVLMGLILIGGLTSCSEKKEGDNTGIGLATSQIKFGKEGGVQEVEAKHASWWISEALLNDKNLLTDSTLTYIRDGYQCPIGIESDLFSIKKKDNVLAVELSPIKESESREFFIVLQHEGYYEHLFIYQ